MRRTQSWRKIKTIERMHREQTNYQANQQKTLIGEFIREYQTGDEFFVKDRLILGKVMMVKSRINQACSII
jgi:hypothetical protein